MPSRLSAVPPAIRDPAAAIAFGALYLLVAELARSLGPTDTSLLWAPSGLLLGVLLVSGRRRWPHLLCATLAAAIGANMLAGNSPTVSLAFAVPSCAEGLLGALVVLRLTDDRFSLERLRDVVALILGAAVVTNGLTALSAAAAAVQAFDVSFTSSWLRWWSADALGILVLTPIVVSLANLPRLASRSRLREMALVAAGICAIALFLASAEPLGAATVVAGALALPLLLWAGWRFSPAVSALGVLLLALVATYLAPRTADPLGLGSIPSAEIVIVQAFLGVLVVAALAFGAAAAERRAAAAGATRGRDRLRELMSTAPDAYVSIDDSGLITEWSPRAETTFGWPREDALGRRLQDTIAPEPDREDWNVELRRDVAADEPDAPAPRLVAKRKSGSELPVEVRISPCSGHDRDASHLFIRDVSERERLRSELLETKELLSQRADELAQATDRAERLGDGLAGRSEELSLARKEQERIRAELELAGVRHEEKERELAEVLSAMSATGRELESLRAELVHVEASHEANATRLAAERTQLQGALDAMVMSFAEADRERRLLTRRSTELIVRYDRLGLCRYASPAARELLGYEPAELVGRQGAELLHPDDRPAMHRARSAESGTTFDARLVRRDGGLAAVEVTFAPSHDPESGKLVEIEASIRSRPEAAEAPPRRRVSQARFGATFGDSPVGMALLSLDGRVRKANAALCRLTGHAREELEAGGLERVVNPDDTATLEEAVKELRTGERRSLQAEHRLVRADGRELPVSISIATVSDGDRQPVELVAQILDLSERAAAREELQRLSDHDPLTGLYSPARFEEQLRAELAAADRYDTRGAVLVANLDRFTELNGLLGRSRGDEIIRAVAYALRQRLRTTDIVSRAGGDRFAVLLPRAEGSQATEVAEALLDAVREVGSSDPDRPSVLTASIGIAMFGADREITAEELLVESEIAVQDAKHAGGDRASTYEPDTERATTRSEGLGWADQIRAAIEDDRFVLYAEPVVSLTGDRLPRYELLPRMVAASGELVPPSAFLPAAERFGIAGDLDRWLLRNAIGVAAREGSSGSTARLEVALSTKAPADPDLHTFVAEELERTGADPSRLCLTIAETAAIHGTDRTSLFLRRLADLGCEVGLDRFGAGVASFLHVERLPVAYVKVDGALVERLSGAESARLIVKSIADIAHGLGMRTMAPAVSDEDTLGLLRELGVGYVQGSALAAARPVTDVELSRSPAALQR